MCILQLEKNKINLKLKLVDDAVFSELESFIYHPVLLHTRNFLVSRKAIKDNQYNKIVHINKIKTEGIKWIIKSHIGIY